jgi:hypothetical protein
MLGVLQAMARSRAAFRFAIVVSSSASLPVSFPLLYSLAAAVELPLVVRRITLWEAAPGSPVQMLSVVVSAQPY